jgi:hypothetical protein
MKYIMLKRGDQEVPVIFPDFLNHNDVARQMRGVFELSTSQPVSAGMINVVALSTDGKSTTLELEARDEDASIITTYDYFYGLTPMPNLAQTERLVLTAVLRGLVEQLQP